MIGRKILFRVLWKPGNWNDASHKAAQLERRERIEFLLWLASADPMELSKEDLTNVAYGLVKYHLAPLPPESSGNYPKDFPGEMADDLVRWIKGDPARLSYAISGVRDLLIARADRKEPRAMPLAPGTVAVFRGSGRAGERSGFAAPRDAGGPGRGFGQTVCITVQNLLDSDDGDLVNRCKRAECHQVFLAGRRDQDFCSRTCANIAGFDRYKKAFIATHGEAAYRASRVKAVQKTRGRKSDTPPSSPRKAMSADAVI